jgi:hypothetical protein
VLSLTEPETNTPTRRAQETDTDKTSKGHERMKISKTNELLTTSGSITRALYVSNIQVIASNKVAALGALKRSGLRITKPPFLDRRVDGG